jgi:hypothetical protein
LKAWGGAESAMGVGSCLAGSIGCRWAFRDCETGIQSPRTRIRSGAADISARSYSLGVRDMSFRPRGLADHMTRRARYWRKGCQPSPIEKARVFSIFQIQPTSYPTPCCEVTGAKPRRLRPHDMRLFDPVSVGKRGTRAAYKGPLVIACEARGFAKDFLAVG